MDILLLHAIARVRDGFSVTLLDVLRRCAPLASGSKVLALGARDTSGPDVAAPPSLGRRQAAEGANAAATT
jgi:hypothetical protein